MVYPYTAHPSRDRAIVYRGSTSRADRFCDTVQSYIAGDRFTVADITALAGLAFGGFCQITIPETAPHLKAWHDRMQQRPSFSA